MCTICCCCAGTAMTVHQNEFQINAANQRTRKKKVIQLLYSLPEVKFIVSRRRNKQTIKCWFDVPLPSYFPSENRTWENYCLTYRYCSSKHLTTKEFILCTESPNFCKMADAKITVTTLRKKEYSYSLVLFSTTILQYIGRSDKMAFRFWLPMTKKIVRWCSH